MSSVIAAITKFQNIALITTAGAVGYWYYQDPKSNLGKQSFSSDAGVEKSGKEGGQGHTLTGDVVDKDKQGVLARAVDTDCEYCLDTRRKFFGFFRAAEKEAKSKNVIKE